MLTRTQSCWHPDLGLLDVITKMNTHLLLISQPADGILYNSLSRLIYPVRTSTWISSWRPCALFLTFSKAKLSHISSFVLVFIISFIGLQFSQSSFAESGSCCFSLWYLCHWEEWEPFSSLTLSPPLTMTLGYIWITGFWRALLPSLAQHSSLGLVNLWGWTLVLMCIRRGANNETYWWCDKRV